jgi:hypothetical protein
MVAELQLGTTISARVPDGEHLYLSTVLSVIEEVVNPSEV